MNALRHVIIDLIVLAVIFLATVLDVTAAWWAVAVYTPLMLLLKILAYAGGVGAGAIRSAKEAPPDWLLHTIYGASVLLLLIDAWYWAAGAWVAIWVLSELAERRAQAARRSGTSAERKKATS